MESHSNEPSLNGEYMPPMDPSGQSTDRLCDTALMALPFIGMFVGVDELVPIKAIYALYDPSNCGISYVRGDGTFAAARHICFTKQFKDSSVPLHRSQRAFLPELMARSAMHYRRTNSTDYFPAEFLHVFPTQSSVRASLTYLGDLVVDSCPALSNFDATLKDPDLTPPHILLEDKPVWNFNTVGFQAISVPGDELVDSKYTEFKRRYPTVRINSVDFQHASFCLAGMVKQGLVSFLYEGQNDLRYFVKNQTPVKDPALVMPLRTAKGWTVDCFLARFERFQDSYTKETYSQIPNPINWLEAEMENEARLGREREPRSIGPHMRDDSVISWELLKVMQFRTRGDSEEYPKSLTPKAPRPLRLNDIVTNSGRLRESKYAKTERKERKKADKVAGRGNDAPVDLTGETSFVQGHMVSSPEPVRGRERPFQNSSFQAGREFRIEEVEIMAPKAGQKRKHDIGADSVQSPAVVSDSDATGDLRRKTVKYNRKEVEIEDSSNDAGLERRLRKKKSRCENQPRKAKALVPGADFLFASPGRTLRDEEDLVIKIVGSAANTPQETPRSSDSSRSEGAASQAYPRNQVDLTNNKSELEMFEICGGKTDSQTFSNPRTPSPQTGDRFYERIAGQEVKDTSSYNS